MRLLAATALSALVGAALGAGDREAIDATTASGDKVRLLPNGRWEFVDVAKQAGAKKVADTFPENHLRPEGAQGGWMGGRYVMPGDKDYNRGTLNPKMR
jgi:hypothetical protein